jgi:acyl carrier protein
MTPTTSWTEDQIRSEIKRLIANVTEREPDEIPDSAHFMEELGVDSLMAMEVMIAVDKKFKIDIPEEEFNKAKNVDESVALVQHWLAARDSSAATA